MRACMVAAWWRVEEQRGAARMDGRPSAFKRVSRSLEATQFSRIGSPDAAFACHLRHLLSPHAYHTLRRKLEAGTPLPMSLRAFAAARAAEGRSARAGRDLQQRRLPLYVCYYYPLRSSLEVMASSRALNEWHRPGSKTSADPVSCMTTRAASTSRSRTRQSRQSYQ